MKLNVELIPKTCWGSNLRTKLKKSDWDKIRKEVYTRENMHCHICGAECKSLDAHEIWQFDEKNHIQKLVGIVGLCQSCHNVIHFENTRMRGYGEQAIKHFMKVNECYGMIDFANNHMSAVADYTRRSKITDWKLDVSLIENQGYIVNKD